MRLHALAALGRIGDAAARTDVLRFLDVISVASRGETGQDLSIGSRYYVAGLETVILAPVEGDDLERAYDTDAVEHGNDLSLDGFLR